MAENSNNQQHKQCNKQNVNVSSSHKYPTMEEMVNKKVEELIVKFSEFKVGFNTCYLSKIEAKQCAIFVCDEMLNEGKMIYAGNGIEDTNYKFWILVKAVLNSR